MNFWCTVCSKPEARPSSVRSLEKMSPKLRCNLAFLHGMGDCRQTVARSRPVFRKILAEQRGSAFGGSATSMRTVEVNDLHHPRRTAPSPFEPLHKMNVAVITSPFEPRTLASWMPMKPVPTWPAVTTTGGFEVQERPFSADTETQSLQPMGIVTNVPQRQ